jgi:WD40 repeat protein
MSFAWDPSHTVTSVGFSSDGRRLFSINFNAYLECHDSLSGSRLQGRRFALPLKLLASFARFSRNADRLVTYSFVDGATILAVFDTTRTTPSPLFKTTIKPGISGISTDFSHDGERFAYCNPSSTEKSGISVVTLKDGNTTAIAHRQDYQPRGVAFSPDGSVLAAVLEIRKATPGKSACLFMLHDFKTGKQVSIVSPPGDWRRPQSLLWAADGKTLACATERHQVALWNTEPLAFRCMLPVSCNRISGMAYSPDSKHLAVIDSTKQSENRIVRTFQVRDGMPNPRVFKSSAALYGIAWSPLENALALAGDSEHIRFWNPLDAWEDKVIPAHQGSECWAVAFAPDGKTLASTGDDWALRLWAPGDGSSLGSQQGHSSLVSCIAYSPEGRWLATGSYDKSILVRSATEPHKELHRFKHEHHLRCLAFSKDGNQLASGGRDWVIRLWDTNNGKATGVLTGHSKTVRAVAFSPTNDILASASDDYTVRLWNPVNQTLLATFARDEQTWSLAFSPDGQTLVAGDLKGALTFWNVADWTVRATVHRHTAGVRTLAFSPDGKTLCSGGEDKTVRLWNPELCQELFAFPEQSREINSVAFSPDGIHLAAGLHDGNIAIWHGPNGSSGLPGAGLAGHRMHMPPREANR